MYFETVMKLLTLLNLRYIHKTKQINHILKYFNINVHHENSNMTIFRSNITINTFKWFNSFTEKKSTHLKQSIQKG